MKYLKIIVEIPDYAAAPFQDAMTGNDRDIILAAEKAMNERLGLSLAADKIELSVGSETLVWPHDLADVDLRRGESL